MTAGPPSRSSTDGTCRRRRVLTAVARDYPDLWRKVDRLRALRGGELPDWPEWCFVPLQGIYALLSGGGDRRIPVERIAHLSILGALAAWRVTQGI